MKKKRIEGALENQLCAYAASDYYGFHMPGHKRRMGELGDTYRIDITEIHGFDDLHHPEEGGILGKAQERAARLYGAEETHFLVNGSTAGILSAISGCTSLAGQLLMARNSHRSAYHGAGLRNLKLFYLYPPLLDNLWINGGILSTDVENSLKAHPGIEAVFLTSPTYEGICADVKAIVRICHSYGVPLIVDQAHGAHLPFSEYFPEDALKAGADVVIQSVHKTLPALTQTALLHIQGNLVDRERIRYYLSVYQSSSPSYVLMASIDNCMELLEQNGETLFEAYIKRLEGFRNSCVDLKWLRLMGTEVLGQGAVHDFDKSRLVISTKNTSLTGQELMESLRAQYHLEMEMAAGNYVVGISSVADQAEDFARLSLALHELDKDFREESNQDGVVAAESGQLSGTKAVNLTSGQFPETKCARAVFGQFPKAETVIPLGEALEREMEWVEVEKAGDRIAGSYLYLYPPGIPLAAPGERLTKEVHSQIVHCLKSGLELHGLDENGKIRLIKGRG